MLATPCPVWPPPPYLAGNPHRYRDPACGHPGKRLDAAHGGPVNDFPGLEPTGVGSATARDERLSWVATALVSHRRVRAIAHMN